MSSMQYLENSFCPLGKAAEQKEIGPDKEKN